jgi:hypothetical protein
LKQLAELTCFYNQTNSLFSAFIESNPVFIESSRKRNILKVEKKDLPPAFLCSGTFYPQGFVFLFSTKNRKKDFSLKLIAIIGKTFDRWYWKKCERK